MDTSDDKSLTPSQCCVKLRTSKLTIIITVTVALLLDNMLLTVVFPILPEILKDMDSQRENLSQAKHEENIEKLESNEHFNVGILLAMKPTVQLFTNPFIGYVIHKVGYNLPIVCGLTIISTSTLVFAYANTYFWLIFARAFQGIGSSCIKVSGMALVALCFPDKKERGKIMGYVIGCGVALGVVGGPTFGGFMYEFMGRSSPFLVLALVSIVTLSFQPFLIHPKDESTTNENGFLSIKELLLDPYIIIVSLALMVSSITIAMLDSSLALIMMNNMKVEVWQVGMSFLSSTVSFMIGSSVFGHTFSCFGRWMIACLGLCLMGCSFIGVTMIYTPALLIVPMSIMGFGLSMVNANMNPELGNRVDLKHSSKYGYVYAIGDAAQCAGFAIGPVFAGTLSKIVGFVWMSMITCMMCFAYSPLFFVLRPNKDS